MLIVGDFSHPHAVLAVAVDNFSRIANNVGLGIGVKVAGNPENPIDPIDSGSIISSLAKRLAHFDDPEHINPFDMSNVSLTSDLEIAR